MLKNKFEVLCEEWRIRAQGIDFKERFESLKLPGYNENNLPISYYGNKYVIKRDDFSIVNADFPEIHVDPQVKFAIYHLFYFSKSNPVNSQEYIPLYDIKAAAVYYNAFKNTVLNPFANAFYGKTDLLKQAGKKLGFNPIPFSDAGFEALAFECVPIRFLFWDGDNEFPSGANILFDKNITDFTHEETIITMAEDGVKLLTNAANLEFKMF